MMVDHEIDTETIIRAFGNIQKTALSHAILTDNDANVILIGKDILESVGDISEKNFFDFFETIWLTKEEITDPSWSEPFIVKDITLDQYYQVTKECVNKTGLVIFCLIAILNPQSLIKLKRDYGKVSRESIIRENIFLTDRLRTIMNKTHSMINQMSSVNRQLNEINTQVTTQNHQYKNTQIKLAESSDYLQYNNRRLNMLIKTSAMIGFELDLSENNLLFYPAEAAQGDFKLLADVHSLLDFQKVIHNDDISLIDQTLSSSKEVIDGLFRLKVRDGWYKWMKLTGERSSYSNREFIYGIVKDVHEDVVREFSIYESEGVQRDRISKTIHDQIAQWLVGVKFMVESVGNASDLEDKIKTEIGGVLDQVIHRSRGIIDALQVDLLDYESDCHAYRDLIEHLKNVYPNKIEFEWVGSEKISNFRISYQFFVIFQEAIIYVLQKTEVYDLKLKMTVFVDKISLTLTSLAFNDFDDLRHEDEGLRVILHKCKITNATIETKFSLDDQTSLVITNHL